MFVLTSVFNDETEDSVFPVSDEVFGGGCPDWGGVVVFDAGCENGGVVDVEANVGRGVDAVAVLGTQDNVQGLVDVDGENSGGWVKYE